MQSRALYVEDNELDADLARLAFAKASPPLPLDVVHTVAQAREVLDREAARYAWVLFDLSLPDGDGLQVLKHLRERALPHMAVVVTGTGDEGAVVQAIKLGVDDYVVKRAGYLDALPGQLRAMAAQRISPAGRPRQLLHVLYAENNPHDSALTARHVADHSPQLVLDVVDDGLQVMQRLRQPSQRYDILLLDYRLDELDALELTRQVRAEMGPGLPIVIVTGRGSEDVAVQALRLGATDYLVKEANYLQRLPVVLELAHARALLLQEQERLRHSEAQLLRITQQVPGVISVHTHPAHGQVNGQLNGQLDGQAGEQVTTTTFVSPALAVLFEAQAADLVGSCVPLFRTLPQDQLKVQLALQEVVQQGHGALEPHRVQYRVQLPQAGERWMESHLSSAPLAGAASGAVQVYAYTFDITERLRLDELAREAQAAKAGNQAKTEFLSRMSHDLRTPLNAVLGFSQLLQTDTHPPLSEAQLRHVGYIRSAGEHLLAMISDLLNIARIEAGHALTLACVPLPLHTVLTQLLPLVQPMAQQVSLSVRPGDHALCALAEGRALLQVLTNLTSNAIKYNRVGGQVEVWAEAVGERVALRVRDTGCGFTQAQQAQLFEPFNRLGAERSAVEGHGIGLVIVRQLVHAMQGEIALETHPGEGSTFTVWLLRCAPDVTVAAPDVNV
jgi:signal transduction histidine kinase/DNA-binding response OmpR family regulator